MQVAPELRAAADFLLCQVFPIIEGFGINRSMENDAANPVLVSLHLSASSGDNNLIHHKVGKVYPK